MERVKRKKIPISRRIIASLLAVFMAVTAIITGMSPVTAKAEGSNYTLISLGEERWYDDVFQAMMILWGIGRHTIYSTG